MKAPILHSVFPKKADKRHSCLPCLARQGLTLSSSGVGSKETRDLRQEIYKVNRGNIAVFFVADTVPNNTTLGVISKYKWTLLFVYCFLIYKNLAWFGYQNTTAAGEAEEKRDSVI